jgi:putative nucleotidyltransferase with HDIG domain
MSWINGPGAANREKILKRLDSISTLPSLPDVVVELLKMLGNDDYSIKELMELICQDPSLTARVLKLANSAQYGRSKEIDSLNQALVVLGAREIQHLVTTISVMRCFEDISTSTLISQDHFWAHSLCTAEMSARIAGIFKLHFNGADFTAGLLHDVGKIVLDQHFHKEFVDCTQLAEQRGLPLFEAEQFILGTNHAEIGAILATGWGLPENLCETILHHHEFESKDEHCKLVACVRLANHLVKDVAVGAQKEANHWDLDMDIAWSVLTDNIPRDQAGIIEEARKAVLIAREKAIQMVSSLV